jgi:ribose-phosphate pyrophosphokinase
LSGRLPPGAVVVSPDVGRVEMASAFAHLLGTSVVVLHKRRESGMETEITHLVGDVRGRACLIVDDMISTGGTVGKSIEALLEAGAREEIIVAATHGLFINGAKEFLRWAGVSEVIVTDTVARSDDLWPELRVVSIAPLLAAAIRRFMADGSLGDLR